LPEQWKSGFGQFRYEPREIADAGHCCLAMRLGVVRDRPRDGDEMREVLSASARVTSVWLHVHRPALVIGALEDDVGQ
jgi:hypothetical protein